MWSILLALVDFTSNLSHFQILLSTIPKDEHCLTFKDLYSTYKMNFVSAEMKIFHSIACLAKYIPDSDGTQKDLGIIHGG